MNKNDGFFYHWIKKQTTQVPPKYLDEKISSMAREKLIPLKKDSKIIRWQLSGAFATVAILFFTIMASQKNEMNNESAEMIMNYNTIELMSEASSLSEEEWAQIEGVK